SLGDIARHLYLERLRDDGDYDIRMYSPAIRIDNGERRDVTYFVEKSESFSPALRVAVDGQPYTFERVGNILKVASRVPAGMSREIRMRYENGFEPGTIEPRSTSVYVSAIRRLSDFRDNVVSASGVGRWFIRSYSEKGLGWNWGAFAAG